MNAKQIAAIEELRTAFIDRLRNDNVDTKLGMDIAMTKVLRTGISRAEARAQVLG